MERYFELLNEAAAPRAAQRVALDAAADFACRVLVPILAFLLGLAM